MHSSKELVIYVYGGPPLREGEPRESLISNRGQLIRVIRMKDAKHEW